MHSERTVLFVNQDYDSLTVYGELLRALGYTVLAVDSAEMAVECATSRYPDVIITELRERTARGWKTPDLLKADPRTRSIPLIVLTAWVLPEDRERACVSGYDLFLEKPTTPSDLAERVAELLRT